MAVIDKVRDYWNTNVSNWKIAADFPTGSTEFFAEVERYRFAKLNYLPKHIDYTAFAGQSILDIGCGLATDLSRFANGGAKVTGIDISPSAIELAKKNFAQRGLEGAFQEMDGEQMDFPDNSFDFVYCHTVIHFTPEPAQMISEIYRVLKPGGKALMMTINRQSWLYMLHRFAGVKIDYLDAPVFHRFNVREFDQLAATFENRRLVVERFPVRTEVHSGWKAFLYNTCFVDLYNFLPRRLVGNTGYHLLYFVQK